MVDHLTRVTVDLRAPHAAALGDALEAMGFTVTRDRRRIVGDSTVVGAREAKEQLRARGFQDRDFQIVLEYVRQWGIL